MFIFIYYQRHLKYLFTFELNSNENKTQQFLENLTTKLAKCEKNQRASICYFLFPIKKPN